MEAVAGRIYAQIVSGKFQWQFTQAELPEWADDAFEVVDITDMNPMPTVGMLWDGVQFIFPTGAVETVASVQQIQLALIDKAYDTAMQQPIAYMNTAFQADKDSQDLMNHAITGLQAIVAIGGTVPADFAWYDVNNQPVPMTLVQLQGLFATGVANVNALFVHKQTQKAAIRAATTIADVTAISF
jgi:hypothetical protein